MLAYLFNFVSGVLVLVLEKKSSYAPYHGAQAVALAIMYMPIWIIAAILDAVLLATVPGYPFVRIFGLIFALLYLAVIAWCMYKAYTLCNTVLYRLPVVSSLADFLLRTARPDLSTQQGAV